MKSFGYSVVILQVSHKNIFEYSVIMLQVSHKNIFGYSIIIFQVSHKNILCKHFYFSLKKVYIKSLDRQALRIL